MLFGRHERVEGFDEGGRVDEGVFRDVLSRCELAVLCYMIRHTYLPQTIQPVSRCEHQTQQCCHHCGIRHSFHRLKIH